MLGTVAAIEDGVAAAGNTATVVLEVSILKVTSVTVLDALALARRISWFRALEAAGHRVIA